ncbi:uncharacterized protein LOC143328252 [Chaetodon auriga]|uniref:uncharacterized protein LOC143328252 n=1 Tax=Chaetodon auriga TaxID=39042 RepID=UPI0040329D05
MLPFAVVDFLDGGGVAIVPCKWFTGPEEDYCRWPPGRLNITKAVKDQLVPNTDWPQFRVRILGKAANYAHAREKLLKSEVNSDLQSDSDSGMGKGKRKRWQRLASSSEDESGTATQDQPSSNRSVPSPVQGNTQSKTPQSVNTRPFVWPTLLSTPSAVATTPHICHRVQVDNSAFRDGMFARILTLLEEIKDTQRVHGRMIQTLLSQGDAPAVSVLPEGTVFPLRTVSDVQEMEQKLADPTFHKEVAAVVADIRGGYC